jgi:hypothetical protein
MIDLIPASSASSMSAIQRDSNINQEPTLLHDLDGDEVTSQLETLMELVNLDSTVAGRENSLEYNTFTQIVPLTHKGVVDPIIDVSDGDDVDDDHDVEPQPASSELVQEPFTEMESENAHKALFSFLFEPSESSQDSESTGFVLSDDLIEDLQNLKDRMQHRYNVIRRNLFSSVNGHG